MTILRRPISTSAVDLLSATDNFSLDKRKTEKSNGMRNDLKLFSYFSPQQVGFNTTFYLSIYRLLSSYLSITITSVKRIILEFHQKTI